MAFLHTLIIAAQIAGSVPLLSLSEKDPIVIARKGAEAAGGAIFCRADREDVDVFISRIEGLIASQSNDDVQKVIAKLEFKNLLTAKRASAPEEGCAKHLERFRQTVNLFG